MNGKRRALTQANELMNEKFNDKSFEEKMKALNIDEHIKENVRFKYMELEDIVTQLWFNKTNSEKRQIVKTFVK